MTLEPLLKPMDVDSILGLRPGQSERLARRKKMPHIELPNGEIRFRRSDIEHLILGDDSQQGAVNE